MSRPEQKPVPVSEVLVRQFLPGDETAFRTLNEEWITRYFRLEPKDVKVLGDPQGSILDHGGQILFAIVDGERAGCCALLRMSEDEFEVAKMAVTPSSRGAGVGRKLLEGVVKAGRDAGARRLYLETNDSLKPAIRLYEAVGFRHLPPERVTPSPYARANVYMEMLLT